MESCLNSIEIYYKDIEEYKIDIDNVINHMLCKNETIGICCYCRKSRYNLLCNKTISCELRNCILRKMEYYKEIQIINRKIDRAVNSLIKSNKSLTFISIINKCRFASDVVYQNKYIKDKIRSVLAENKQNRTIKKTI